jgi:hypothetical protein
MITNNHSFIAQIRSSEPDAKRENIALELVPKESLFFYFAMTPIQALASCDVGWPFTVHHLPAYCLFRLGSTRVSAGQSRGASCRIR